MAPIRAVRSSTLCEGLSIAVAARRSSLSVPTSESGLGYLAAPRKAARHHHRNPNG